MKTLQIRSILAAAALCALAAGASAQLKVVATIPDLADIAREIGGELVEVTTIAKGTENIHSVSIKPSHLVAVDRADVLLEIGLALEHAYVPALLEKGRNPRIRPGAPGFVNCSEGWQPLDVPSQVSRSEGADLHPLGNPHMNLDPRAGRHFADRILEAFSRVDPAHEADYKRNHAAYVAKLDAAGKRWAEIGEKLKDKQVAIYHDDVTYFVRAYGMDVVARIEPKPGVPPTPRDLAATVEKLRAAGVKVILTAKWSNNKDVRFVAEKAGAQVVEVPVMVGGVEGAGSWIQMMDRLHASIAAACAEEG